MPWDFIARAFFVGAGVFAVWSTIRTIREALPHIRKIKKELEQ